MKNFWLGCTVLVILFGLIAFSGCVTTFTQAAIAGWVVCIGERNGGHPCGFETSEASTVAGDVTKKAGSICAGGACIIY